MPPHLAIPVHHISTTCPLVWRFRFIIYLQHAPSFGDSGSSYVLNTAPSFGDSGSSYVVNTPPSFGDSVFIIYLKHAPSSCDSGSSHILNTPPHLAILVHYISTNVPKHNDRMKGYTKGNSYTLKQACTATTADWLGGRKPPPHLQTDCSRDRIQKTPT